MQVYMVGGAVRDRVLGRQAQDIDYVVVGSSHTQMLSDGYQQVGAQFPVYLHPTTGDEYALARTERKSTRGHTGFTVTTKNVTLEEDLKRRDLTINAMAIEVGQGMLTLIDPFNGREDLKNGVLRHVSDSFAEDPLRVLRLARFAARFNFQVAPETLQLCERMVASGELESLTAERCWKEISRALTEPHPRRFFEVLSSVGAMGEQVPYIHKLFGYSSMFQNSGLRLGLDALDYIQKDLYTDQYELKLDRLAFFIAVGTDVVYLDGKGYIGFSKAVPTQYQVYRALFAEFRELEHDRSNFAQGLKTFYSHVNTPETFEVVKAIINVMNLFLWKIDFLETILDKLPRTWSSVTAEQVMNDLPSLRGKDIGIELDRRRGVAIEKMLIQTHNGTV